MPRKKKDPRELTTDEAIHKLFPKKVVARAKSKANPAPKSSSKHPRRST